MFTVNAVLNLNGKKIVPVRAIPFVTGDDMSPKCLAGILADPDSWLLASVLGPNNTATNMLPKNWKQYRNQLAVIASRANNLDLANRIALEILPASTFVYWEALWHTHENYFLPDRRELERLPPEEQANYELQPIANIPRALVELVFEGFDAPWATLGPSLGPTSTSSIPIVTTGGRINPPISDTVITTPTGSVSWSITKPKRRDPLSDALISVLTKMCAAGQVRPKARDVLDELKKNKPAEIFEVAYDELKYETSNGNNKLVSIGSLQKRLNKLMA